MAKLQVYKFVNPGSSSVKDPTAAAARTQTLALNRLGDSVSSLGNVLEDINAISITRSKLEKKQIIAERRAKRRELDAKSEEQTELTDDDKKKRKPKLGQKAKRLAKGGFDILEKFLGPIGKFFLTLGAFALTREVMKWLADPENGKKLSEFFEKAKFVFDKFKEFGENIANTIGAGLDFIFGKETTLEERLNAFGKIALAIGGIAGLIAAAGGIRDLLDAGDAAEDLLPDGPDGKKRPQPDAPEGKPKKPTPTNPSGANPDAPGPRGRAPVSNIAEEFGEAASKQYKKILAEYGDDAARAYANALSNAGGNPTKALQAWKRLKLPPLPKPKPNALQRFGNFLGGIGQGAVDLSKKGLNLAAEQGGRLLKSLQGLPSWAVGQYENLSKGARQNWDNLTKAGAALAEKGKGWASAAGNKLKSATDWVVDGGKKAFSSMAAGAKNFFIEKILNPIKPLIEPIAKKAAGIGQGMFDLLMKIPGADKIAEVLKKKGIGSIDDIALAGSKLGKRAAAILPVIGGIVNLAFAYERAASGDSIGALIEGTSGILDIAGLATAGAGSVISMLLDGYMFARDFIPQLQQNEEKTIEAVGAGGLKANIDNILSKLPNIGELINTFMGKSSEGDPEESEEPGQELFLGGIVKGIGDAVSGVAKGIGNVISNPIVQTAAAAIPGVGPLVSAGMGLASGIMSGNPMQAVTGALNVIPGLGGALGGVGNALTGVLNSPLGQIGQSFLSGGIGGALSTGLGMIPGLGGLGGTLAGIGSSLLGGDFMGAAMQGLGAIPGLGGLMSGGLGNVVGSLMGGDIMGAISGGLGMIPGLENLGGIASSLMSGDIMGAITGGLGALGVDIGGIAGGIMNTFGSLMNGDFAGAITGGLGMIPGLGSAFGGLGGLATSILGQAIQGSFSPMMAMGAVAQHFNVGGLFKAVTGALGGDYTAGIKELGAELGVDPKVIGAVEKTSSRALSGKGISAEFAMQQAMEFVPVPMIVEKLLPLPTPVPINKPGAAAPIVTAPPSSITQRTGN